MGFIALQEIQVFFMNSHAANLFQFMEIYLLTHNCHFNINNFCDFYHLMA